MTLVANNPSASAGLVLGIASAVIAFVAGAFMGTTVLGLVGAVVLAALPALLAVIFGFIGLNRGGKRAKSIWAIVLGFTPWAFALLGLIAKLSLFG